MSAAGWTARLVLAVRRSPDLALAAAALAIVTLLVAPLPPLLLDLCIACNLALSATILVVSLFARDALRLASFPTLLLFTTLFRLALEVSSTRLVLARGEAGRIIEAFGQVVVAGNYVVGAVVFAILTLVQLLVVTRGAERVAEVAARFTLDSLPGKQMSIDADLRAGAIDTDEARRRRRALEREGQLHGAMDGALKFVKGDAIAGVAIVLVNVAGGLVAGLVRGLPLETAARRYALLAIGDGLVAQIPALLVSVAAGVAVTRVAADEEGAGLAEDLGRQLFGDARVLATVAVLCGALALFPGMPSAPFAALAALAGAGALHRARRSPRAPAPGAPPAGDAASGAPSLDGPPIRATALALELAPDLVAAGWMAILQRELLPALRGELLERAGVPLPAIAVRAARLPAAGWRLLIDEVPAAAGRCPADEAVALVAPAELDAVGIPAEPDRDPATGVALARIAAAHAARAAALAPVRGPVECLGAALAATLRRDAHLLVGVQEVQALLDDLESTHPALVREAVRQVPTPVLADVVRQLLEEGVSIRPFRRIVEALLTPGGAAAGPAVLVQSCRRALRRQIAHQHAAGGTLQALLLDPAAEARVREALDGEVAALEPLAARALLAGIERLVPAREEEARVVVLSSADVRRALRQLVAQRFPRIAVLSYDELPPALPVRALGKIELGGDGVGG